MNTSTAQSSANNSPSTENNNKVVSLQPVSVTHAGKESEPVKTVEVSQAAAGEIIVPPEVEKAGVTTIKDTIELPPDVKKLGITHAGSSVPVTATVTVPQVILPISDSQVVLGLHANVGNAISWLAAWCVKKLKKAHVTLKVIHGKIIRVRVK
jgi:hypothetical protein